jgi:hypothetical protein
MPRRSNSFSENNRFPSQEVLRRASNPFIGKTNSVINKIRRGSYSLTWDACFDIPKKLKQLRKHRLEISQAEFNKLQYQLYTAKCIDMNKDGPDYVRVANTSFFKNEVYVKLSAFIPCLNFLKLLIWRHFNQIHAVPSSHVLALMNSTIEDAASIDTTPIRETTIKINDYYTLRRLYITVKQRKALANSRDFYIYNRRNFLESDIFVTDLEWTEHNQLCMKEFLLGLLKAKVDAKTIQLVCKDILLHHGRTLETSIHLERRIVRTLPQRKSITDFNSISLKEQAAAIILQRYYRKRLEKLRQAIQVIENWWEHWRLRYADGRAIHIHIRTSFAQQLEGEMVNEFQYTVFAEELKRDYREVSKVHSPTPYFWGQTFAILIVCSVVSYFLVETRATVLAGLLQGSSLIGVFMPFAFMQCLTYFYKIKPVLWLQTLMLLLYVISFLRVALGNQVAYGRLCIIAAIVATTGSKWKATILLLLFLRWSISFVLPGWEVQGAEYGVFLYDIYVALTLKATSKEKTPIKMLHKSMVYIVWVFIVAFAIIASCTLSCGNLYCIECFSVE